jgi:hypothetical protein
VSYRLSASRSLPTRTARSVRSSSQSIRSSAKARLLGFPQNLGPIEVGQHQDVEELRAGSGTEGVEALTELGLDLLEVNADRTVAAGGDEDWLGATERGGVDRLARLRDGPKST